MIILEKYPLKKFNTFGVRANAKYYCEINYMSDLQELVNSNVFNDNDRLILGGGSNILFTRDFDGLVINMNLKGTKIIFSDERTVEIEVAAGVIWHDFVKTCLNSKYFGLENLALIPGKVGAAPVQNIGAYGVEQKDFFYYLKALDFSTKEMIELNKADCCFGYRDSIFKNELKDKAIVTSVVYRLSKKFIINDSYKALKQQLDKFSFVEQDARYIFDTVCRIRKSKLPEVDKIGNGGSFFKNPAVGKSKAEELKEKFPELPVYPTKDGKYKISAAWLIDQCGLKGYKRGDAGVYKKHALILVNHGHATGRELYDLSKEIIEEVDRTFGILLEREVSIY